MDASSSVASLTSETSTTTDDTDSTTHTIPGPGALSGRAILALGKATLRGAETLIIRRRLHVISSKFPHYDENHIQGIERMYEDLVELSRRGLYPDAIRIRALDMLLMQIRRQHVEKLVHYLATLPSTALQIFVSDLIEMFSPLQLFEHTKESELSSSVEGFRTSVIIHQGRILEPVLYFFHHLVCVSEKATRAVFGAGVIEFLVHINTLGFAPVRSRLRFVCDTLMDACLETKDGWDLFREDRYHVLWTLQTTPLSFPWLDRLARRAEAWRSMKPEIVKMRMLSISKMMVKGQLEGDFLDNIAADILEFWRHDGYEGMLKTQVIDMILVLAGKRRTEEVVFCLTTWPSVELQALIPGLTELSDSDTRWATKPKGTRKVLGSKRVRQNSAGSEKNHSRESIVTFLNQVAHASPSCSYAMFEGGILNFLLQLYLTSFSDPLSVEMFRGRITLREACDTLLHTLSETERGSDYIRRHRLSVLWPTTPNLQFTSTVLGRPVARAEIWRSINPEFIHLRLTSILTIIRAKSEYQLDLPEFHPLGDIVYDSLEVLRFVGHCSARVS